MLKGLAITPPVLGRISIGRFIEKNGKHLPEKDDQFTVTTQIQTRDGWLNHPLDKALRDQAENGKLRAIPITLLFDDPELNFRAEYTLFDRATGRPLCAGDGISCRRQTPNGLETHPCPSPTLCPLAADGRCKPYGRLNVRIGEEDGLGTFIFRTTGFNSIRTLTARLRYFQAVSGGLLAGMPLELRLRGKSTTQSHRAPIYYVDLCVREGQTLEEAIAAARAVHQHHLDIGYDQQALDQAARQGFANASFEDDAEEAPAILEEFYSDDPTTATRTTEAPQPSLKDKLRQKAAAAQPPADPAPASFSPA